MKYRPLLITTLLIAGVATGCTSAEGKIPTPPGEAGTVAVQGEKLKVETKEAARAMRAYAYAQKNELIAQMKTDLASIEVELDRLSTKVDSSKRGAKVEAKANLEKVRQKWKRTKEQLDRAEAATESSWDRMNRELNEAYEDLTDSFAQTRQWLSDKIEP